MRKPRFIFVGLSVAAWLAAGAGLHGQSETALSAPPPVPVLIERARRAEAEFKPSVALALFREADLQKPNDPLILQAISKQLSDHIDEIPDRPGRLNTAHEALTAAQRAAELAPRNSLCVAGVAICYGKIARDAGSREKVHAAQEVKTWAETALELDAQNEWAEHVLGAWNLELAKVGPTERAFAGLFYGAVPEGSLADGILHLQKAVQIAPTNASHHIALGFAYLKNGDNGAAQREFRAGLALPSRDLPDETAKAQARTALVP